MKLRFLATPQDLTIQLRPQPEAAVGFVVRTFYAQVGSVRAGQIQINLFSQEAFNKKCPTLWHYLAKVDSWMISNPDDLDAVWRACKWELFHSRPEVQPDLGKRSEDLARWAIKLQPKMDAYQRDHVDKPEVGFIEVFEEWQRRGIGIALYTYAAQWLAQTYNLPLYASTTQSLEAKATWEAMKDRDQFPIQALPDGRLKLDYTRPR